MHIIVLFANVHTLRNRNNKVNQAFEISVYFESNKSNEALPNSPKPTSFLLETYIYNKFNSVSSQMWKYIVRLAAVCFPP